MSRPHFSLRTFFILIAIIGFAIGSYFFGKRLHDAEREVQRLRNEAGYLTIDDPTQLHVIAVETGEPETWRWRMFIPKGHRYSWNISAEQIPQNEPPQQAGAMGASNEPYSDRDNELLVTARLRRAEDGNWRLSIDSRIGDSPWQMSGASLTIPDEKLQWMKIGPGTDGQVAGSSGVSIRDPKKPLILLQRRPLERKPDGTHEPSPNPMPGFMIWLAPM
jgi:hypothetical protein